MLTDINTRQSSRVIRIPLLSLIETAPSHIRFRIAYSGVGLWITEHHRIRLDSGPALLPATRLDLGLCICVNGVPLAGPV